MMGSKWIPIVSRPMDEDEREYYESHYQDYSEHDADILISELPEDGQEVLITTASGNVSTDTFCKDDVDGCYFENFDIEDVLAWMPFPEPYKGDHND